MLNRIDVENDPINAIDPMGLQLTKKDIVDSIINGLTKWDDPKFTTENLLDNACAIQYAKDLKECQDKEKCGNDVARQVCEIRAMLHYESCKQEYGKYKKLIDVSGEIGKALSK